MGNLIIKNNNTTKTYECKSTYTGKPYLQVNKNSYLDLTTASTSGLQMKMKINNKTYRPMQTYVSTSSSTQIASTTTTSSYNITSRYTSRITGIKSVTSTRSVNSTTDFYKLISTSYETNSNSSYTLVSTCTSRQGKTIITVTNYLSSHGTLASAGANRATLYYTTGSTFTITQSSTTYTGNISNSIYTYHYSWNTMGGTRNYDLASLKPNMISVINDTAPTKSLILSMTGRGIYTRPGYMTLRIQNNSISFSISTATGYPVYTLMYLRSNLNLQASCKYEHGEYLGHVKVSCRISSEGSTTLDTQYNISRSSFTSSVEVSSSKMVNTSYQKTQTLQTTIEL